MDIGDGMREGKDDIDLIHFMGEHFFGITEGKKNMKSKKIIALIPPY